MKPIGKETAYRDSTQKADTEVEKNLKFSIDNTMELKIWVEGIQRIVCGVTEDTTCQVDIS